jgi:hypothetical protein
MIPSAVFKTTSVASMTVHLKQTLLVRIHPTYSQTYSFGITGRWVAEDGQCLSLWYFLVTYFILTTSLCVWQLYVYWKKELCLWRVLPESVISPDRSTHKALVYCDCRFGQPSASFSGGWPLAIKDGRPKHTHCEDMDWILSFKTWANIWPQ